METHDLATIVGATGNLCIMATIATGMLLFIALNLKFKDGD